MDIIPLVKRLRELAFKPNTELDDKGMRELVYYFILMNTHQQVPQVMTARINNWELFYKHLETCKNYFKSFILDD